MKVYAQLKRIVDTDYFTYCKYKYQLIQDNKILNYKLKLDNCKNLKFENDIASVYFEVKIKTTISNLYNEKKVYCSGIQNKKHIKELILDNNNCLILKQ